MILKCEKCGAETRFDSTDPSRIIQLSADSLNNIWAKCSDCGESACLVDCCEIEILIRITQ